MYTLYLLQYNNYYNRIIKKEETLVDYLNNYEHLTLQSVNFCTNDGVNGTQVINEDASAYNYAIYEDQNGNLLRYFIMESKQTRGNQYALTLRRDLITDYFEQIKGSPFYCVKGRVGVNNSLIYNAEDISVNQIKINEVPIKDGTNVPWVVGYVAQTTQDITWSKGKKVIPDFTEASITGWQWATYITSKKLSRTVDVTFNNKYNSSLLSNWKYNINFNKNGLVSYNRVNVQTGYVELGINYNLNDSSVEFLAANLDPNGLATETAINTYCIGETEEEQLLNLNGKIVKFNDQNAMFKMKLVKFYGETSTYDANAGTIANELDEQISTFIGSTVTRTSKYTVTLTGTKYMIELEPVQQEGIKGTVNHDTITLNDAPYKMFAMPYDIMDVKVDGETVRMTADVSLRAAMGIAEAGTSYIYDVQLLPYCPCYSLFDGTKMDLTGLAEDVEYSKIKDITTDTVVGAVIWCTDSSFRAVSYDYSVQVPANELKTSVVCDMVRYCSPNYNGQFEISPARNGGEILYTEIECTYKPYSPYIHLAPRFEGLYGSDFDDARGLICGGDFSLPTATDAWKNYELNNKNYQVSFDRQIQSMELRNKYATVSDALGALSGTVQAGIMGAQLGGPAGAAGAAVGSALTGVADIAINKSIRDDQMQLSKDMFKYSLGNIQAMPNSLTKVSAFNINNKIFPFVEVYTCTALERELVKLKIQYEGMTIGAMGTILDYRIENGDFVKGSLILSLDGFQNGDYHEMNELNNELMKGVYLSI